MDVVGSRWRQAFTWTTDTYPPPWVPSHWAWDGLGISCLEQGRRHPAAEYSLGEHRHLRPPELLTKSEIQDADPWSSCPSDLVAESQLVSLH